MVTPNKSQRKFVVAGEIVKIHGYLSKAPRLRYVEGGSRLLEIFSTTIIPTLVEKIEPGNKPLIAAAARFLVAFENEKNARTFLQLTEFLTERLLGQGRLVQCGPMENRGDEEQILKEIRCRLDKRKGASLTKSPIMPGLQFMEQCQACGAWSVEHSEKGEWLCDLCRYKVLARNGKRISVGFSNLEFLPDGFPARISICPHEEGTDGGDSDGAIYVPYRYEKPLYREFQKMGDQDPTGYIGLFYADGNSMGTLFSGRKTLDEYSSFSNEISRKNDEALKKARNSALDDSNRFAGVVLVKGGDDLLAVLPATKAVEFARAFLEKVTETGTPFKEGVCAGLVFSKPSMPFTTLWDQAEDLIRNAKYQVWQKHGPNSNGVVPAEKSAIDFRQVSSSLLAPIRGLPERLAYLADEPQEYHLVTARPYLLEEFKNVLKKLQKFHELGLPKGVVMALKDIFRPGKLDSSRVDSQGGFIELERLIARQESLRHGNTGIRKVFELTLAEDKWKYPDHENPDTPRDARRNWQGDMVEIVNFVVP